MTILVTGSSGKTSSRLASLLRESSHPFLIASRSGSAPSPYTAVRFDWLDPSTYPGVFTCPQAQQSPITAVYIVAPSVADLVTPVKSFIDFAKEKGVKRFVLLSSSGVDKGHHLLGKVHALLEDSGSEWTVLRASWFMENFSEEYVPIIKASNQIHSATQDGKIPFISADDIAAVAHRALTDETPHNTDHIITGPDLLTYDDVAALISQVSGRTVTHVRLSPEQRTEQFVEFGVPREFAEMLTALDVGISEGVEERNKSDEVERITRRKPRGMRDFVEKNKEVWKAE